MQEEVGLRGIHPGWAAGVPTSRFKSGDIAAAMSQVLRPLPFADSNQLANTLNDRFPGLPCPHSAFPIDAEIQFLLNSSVKSYPAQAP